MFLSVSFFCPSRAPKETQMRGGFEHMGATKLKGEASPDYARYQAVCADGMLSIAVDIRS